MHELLLAKAEAPRLLGTEARRLLLGPPAPRLGRHPSRLQRRAAPRCHKRTRLGRLRGAVEGFLGGEAAAAHRGAQVVKPRRVALVVVARVEEAVRRGHLGERRAAEPRREAALGARHDARHERRAERRAGRRKLRRELAAEARGKVSEQRAASDEGDVREERSP